MRKILIIEILIFQIIIILWFYLYLQYDVSISYAKWNYKQKSSLRVI